MNKPDQTPPPNRIIKYEFRITGITEMVQGQYIPTNGERVDEAWERRNWKRRMHVEDGKIVIPNAAIKTMLSEAARRKKQKLRGQQTFSTIFAQGVLPPLSSLVTNVDSESVKPWERMVESGGNRASTGSKLVMRIFPKIPAGWETIAPITILDPLITMEVLAAHMDYAGNFIGLGCWRPQNGGWIGRFKSELLGWEALT